MHGNHEDLARLSDLIGLIYEGATDPSRWTNDILPAVAEYARASKCVLFTPFQMPQNGGFGFIHGISQQQMELYITQYQPEDIHALTAVAKGLVFEGNVILDTDLISREQLLESKYYREFLLREDMDKIMSTIVFGPDSGNPTSSVICSLWRGRDAQMYAEQDRERLKLLVPHLSRSLGVMQRLRSAELTMASSLDALDRLPSGVLMLDGNGRMAFANRSAQRMLEDGDGLQLHKLTKTSALGNLIVQDPAANQAVNDAITATLNRDPYTTPHFSSCVTVPRPSGLANYTLQFSALGRHSEFGGNSGAFSAIIFIADGAQSVGVDPVILHSVYGLTPAESRVAAALLDASSAQEVSDNLGISLNTAGTHIKRIYAKLGVDTRARFVKLMMGLAQQRP